jgi:AcrR family transcriptional regulator
LSKGGQKSRARKKGQHVPQAETPKRSPRRIRPSSIKAEIASIKRQRILEEATNLFFEHGYAATTLEAVAERMGVTKPFIYSYFDNKTEILTAVSETGIDESLAALDKGEHEAVKPLNQLRVAMAAAAKAVIRVQKYVVVYQRELKSLDPVDARRILEKRQQFDLKVAAILSRGVEEGEMRVANPGMTSVWIGGLLSWIPVWYNPAGRRKQDEVVAEFVAAVERLVL